MKIIANSKRNVIMLVLASAACLCCLLLVSTDFFGEIVVYPPPFYKARITDIRPCQGLDVKTRLPIDITEPFHTSDEQLTVCAYLEVDYFILRDFAVPLSFSWWYGDWVVHSSGPKLCNPGYIVDSFKLSEWEYLQPGIYKVEVESGRAVLASHEFLVSAGR